MHLYWMILCILGTIICGWIVRTNESGIYANCIDILQNAFKYMNKFYVKTQFTFLFWIHKYHKKNCKKLLLYWAYFCHFFRNNKKKTINRCCKFTVICGIWVVGQLFTVTICLFLEWTRKNFNFFHNLKTIFCTLINVTSNGFNFGADGGEIDKLFSQRKRKINYVEKVINRRDGRVCELCDTLIYLY